MGALALDDEQRAIFFEAVKMGPWMQEMIVVFLLDILRVETVAGRVQHLVLLFAAA